LRYDFRDWLETIDIKNLVFIDETGVNLAMTRLYGRGVEGARVYDERPGSQGKNITVIGAMSDEGLIATMTFPGSLNTAIFLVFIEQILLPQLWVGAIVVMDNLSVHYAETAIALIESVGAKVKFLPPYSPDLSPIHPTFRRAWFRIVNFDRLLQQVVSTTGGSKKPQNFAALRGEMSDLLVSCDRHQMDRLKALKDPSHCGFISQLA